MTAKAGSISFETGGDFTRSVPNFITGQARDRIDAPLLRLVFSPADPVEIDVEWVGRVVALKDPTFGTVSDFGDVTLRCKTRVWGPARGAALAARFAVSLPETNEARGLGPNALRMSADLLFTRTFDKGRVHANAGLALQDRPLQAHAQSDFFAYGLAAERALSTRLTAVAEIAGLTGKGAPGADERSEVRAGLRFSVGKAVVDGAARVGLAAADGGFGFTAGLRVPLR